MLKAFQEIKIRPVSWFKAGVYTIILALVYYSALKWMIMHDWYREDYSHCFLIPFVVIYLIWEKRQKLNEYPSAPSWFGIVPIFLGILLFWIGEFAGEYFTLYLSLWFVIIGLFWMHLGWQKIKTIWFALVMMLTMFPFPNFLSTKISFQLQLISSKLGIWMIHLYGMSGYREGNVIDLGFTKLQVVEACSGLRYLIPITVLSLLLAYFFRAHIWKKILLFISSIPLAIVVNSFRIALTGVLYSVWGAKVAEGFFHGFSGWLIFIIALGFLLLEMWILSWLPPRERADADTPTPPHPHTPTPVRKSLYVFAAAVFLLGVTLIFSRMVEFREKIPVVKSFSQFPVKVGQWTGVRQTMEPVYLKSLYFSDYIMADYRNSQGKEVNFYVAYYESQRKGESIHSPETCLPGGGWIFKDSGTTTVDLAGHNPGKITVNRAFMERADTRGLVYFWFPMRGRVLTTLYGIKLATFWDAMTRQRTDGALVRVVTPVYKDEAVSEAEARLAAFTRDIVPLVDEFIPK